MTFKFRNKADAKTIPITPVEKAVFAAWLKNEPKEIKNWLKSSGFSAKPGEISLIPDASGTLTRVIFGVKNHDGLWDYAGLPKALPIGSFSIDARMAGEKATNMAIGWALGCYQFAKYKSAKPQKVPTLVWPENAEKGRVKAIYDAVTLVRDLINTPADDMGPAELAAATRRLGKKFKADVRVITGNNLLKQNYPTIHAVGRASDDPPRLIDLRWGKDHHPKVSIVGKGVCFDTGGLDLKPAAGMLRMKKDMGGAAHALALASLIMELRLPVRLRVLVPAVENNVSGNAYRPSDVIKTRKGITVEVGNTDAEGRLVLADALSYIAKHHNPACMINFATLTGAVIVALGHVASGAMGNDEKLIRSIIKAGDVTGEKVWELPLWEEYCNDVKSKIADVKNLGAPGQAGSIAGGAFLKAFVDDVPWVHLDIAGTAWWEKNQPYVPSGPSGVGVRLSIELLNILN